MSELADKFPGSQIEDIAGNPKKYGMPTFKEYCRNREKYIGRKDDTFNIVDKGSKALGRVAKKYTYEIEGRRCKSLEEVERVAKNELGLDINALGYRPHCIPLGGGKCDVLVKFMSKNERQQRENW